MPICLWLCICLSVSQLAFWSVNHSFCLSACHLFMYLSVCLSVFWPFLCLFTHQSFHKIWLETLVVTIHAQFSVVGPFNIHYFCPWSQRVTHPFTTLNTRDAMLTNTNNVEKHYGEWSFNGPKHIMPLSLLHTSESKLSKRPRNAMRWKIQI